MATAMDTDIQDWLTFLKKAGIPTRLQLSVANSIKAQYATATIFASMCRDPSLADRANTLVREVLDSIKTQDGENISLDQDIKDTMRDAIINRAILLDKVTSSHIDDTDLSTYPQLEETHPFCELVRTLENCKLTNGRFIKFERVIQHTEFRFPSRGIMVRECYPRLKDLMLTNKANPIHLGGTPGTGQSAFMYYLLFCVIHAHDDDWPKDSLEREYHSVLFDSGRDSISRFYLWRRGQPILAIHNKVPLVCLNKPGVLQLIECEARKQPLVISHTTTVIAASPLKFRQADVHKIEGLKSFFMPVWSLEELLDCLQNIFNQNSQEKIDMLTTLYKSYGGVPSSVIIKGVMAIESDSALEDYINVLKHQVIAEERPHKIIDIVEANYGKNEQYHSLVHYAVDDDTFMKTKLVFASRKITDMVIDACLERSRTGMIELLNGCLTSASLPDSSARTSTQIQPKGG